MSPSLADTFPNPELSYIHEQIFKAQSIHFSMYGLFCQSGLTKYLFYRLLRRGHLLTVWWTKTRTLCCILYISKAGIAGTVLTKHEQVHWELFSLTKNWPRKWSTHRSHMTGPCRWPPNIFTSLSAGIELFPSTAFWNGQRKIVSSWRSCLSWARCEYSSKFTPSHCCVSVI